MENKKIKKASFQIRSLPQKSAGAIPRGLLILAGVIIAALIITFIIIKIAAKPPVPSDEEEEPVYQPVYEAVLGDVKIKLKEARDRGKILRGSESRYPKWQKDLTTQEKFIEITISAENIGKTDISGWNMEEVIDEEERLFREFSGASSWIPEESQCGTVLKPGFAPKFCTRIYEVAEVSNNFKVKVSSGQKNVFLDVFLLPEGIEYFFPEKGK